MLARENAQYQLTTGKIGILRITNVFVLRADNGLKKISQNIWNSLNERD